MSLTLFTDGSVRRHHPAHFIPNAGKVGWGYVLTDEDTVLYAECGDYPGATSVIEAEMMAVIQGLLALSPQTEVCVVTDSSEVIDIISGKIKKKHATYLTSLKRLLCLVYLQSNATIRVVRSGSHPHNQYADALARRGCGLKPKTPKQWAKIRHKQNSKATRQWIT